MPGGDDRRKKLESLFPPECIREARGGTERGGNWLRSIARDHTRRYAPRRGIPKHRHGDVADHISGGLVFHLHDHYVETHDDCPPEHFLTQINRFFEEAILQFPAAEVSATRSVFEGMRSGELSPYDIAHHSEQMRACSEVLRQLRTESLEYIYEHHKQYWRICRYMLHVGVSERRRQDNDHHHARAALLHAFREICWAHQDTSGPEGDQWRGLSIDLGKIGKGSRAFIELLSKIAALDEREQAMSTS